MHLVLPTTLTVTAAAVLVHLWLSIRIGKVRVGRKISIGDGGDNLLARRMRAHANFTENAALVLILIAALEVSGENPTILWAFGFAFIVARILHAFGMEDDKMLKLRQVGVGLTFLIQLTLAGWAVWTAHAPLLGSA